MYRVRQSSDPSIELVRPGEQADDGERLSVEVEEVPWVNEQSPVQELKTPRFLGPRPW